jgi:hypothetical protein
MKLLASLAFGTATLVASTFGLAQPAMAHDDVTVGVRLGPLCVGLCIGDDGDSRDGYGDRDDECYDFDCDGTGFYSHRDYYHQRYDRRVSYDESRDDGYAGYRRHGGGHHGKHHHHDRDGDDGDDD